MEMRQKNYERFSKEMKNWNCFLYRKNSDVSHLPKFENMKIQIEAEMNVPLVGHQVIAHDSIDGAKLRS